MSEREVRTKENISAIQWAERRLAALKKKAQSAAERERQARQNLTAAISKARRSGSTAAEKAVTKAREKQVSAAAEKEQAIFMVREASILLRDENKLAKALERTELARPKAVSAFLKKWEREQDKKLLVLKKNIAVRKKQIKDSR